MLLYSACGMHFGGFVFEICWHFLGGVCIATHPSFPSGEGRVSLWLEVFFGLKLCYCSLGTKWIPSQF